MSIMDVKDLEVEYVMPNNIKVKALKGVTLSVSKGDVIGIVGGESGSGKTTLAMAMMRMIKPPIHC